MRVTGKVFRGKREGTKIGFPTANIKINEDVEPGIFAGYADLPDGQSGLEALFYIAQNNKNVVECHILDFRSTDLYGLELSVEIAYKLRDDQDFANLEKTREQIKKDEQEGRKWFKQSKN